MDQPDSAVTDGEASAAFLSAGIGIFVFGVLTMLKTFGGAIKSFLSFYFPAGPLSGQTTLAIAVWLITWFILYKRWKNRNVNFNRIFIITLVLITLGLLATFPPLFEAFTEFEE